MRPVDFLKLFVPEALGEGEAFLIWTMDPNGAKRSSWFRDADKAAAFARRCAGKANVYFAPSIFNAGLGGKRGAVQDVIGVNAFVADTDIANTAHAKPGLPPDLDAAKAILAACPLAPSVIWNTGGGLQAAWLLHETEWLSDATRPQVAALSKGWQIILSNVAHRAGGYVTDSVGSLEHVFRVPGSMNLKPEYGSPRPVEVIEAHPERRYSLDDIREFADLDGLTEDVPTQAGLLDIVLRPNPEINREFLQVLLEEDTKFRGSWHRTRPDIRDQSLSSYDLSISTILAGFGLEDQQIADYLVVFRHMHGGPKDRAKALRRDYVSRTIQKARKTVEARNAG
ncbi:hypothetical protein NNJEOMEG_00048 [Fundidesulfovibrio magnetotacticus]|uniref:RepB-like DNA primase domain-containing protein n=1 Tax=Fundidesulfovibrio magnetotacticus TaxID=2730080 RepID=A0A6V8LR43_9BACT|nr:hypothetical protein [Fundidesulfovibrio magnetotacticus]GFK92226.1 hypothetical protein NNJEOMEG_00048 [Fundidesulfovibrio magnetotacticus]